MAIRLGSAYGKVELDASGVTRGVGSAITGLQKLSVVGTQVGNALKKAGTMMTVGLTLPILAIGAASIKAASDLEETRNKVNVVFGEMSDDVLKWGEDSAKAFGMSKQEALEAAGTFGNLFTSMGLGKEKSAEMSEGLIQLAADLASFNDIDPAIVLEKLRSGLVGEVEPLRTLGVNLTMAATRAKAMEMGLADVNGEISQAALVQARYALILEQTTNAQGDFARTSDGLANSTRTLRAEWKDTLAMLGENILPMALEVVKGLNKLLEAFNNMPPVVQKAVIGFGVFLALLGPLLSFIGTVLTIISSLATLGVTVGGVATVFSTLGAILFGTVIPAIAAFVVAAAPVILAILLIVGAIALLYWAFKTNFGGITTTVKQGWAIIKWAFTDGWNEIKKVNGAMLEKVSADWAQGMDTIANRLNTGIAGWKLALTTIWQWVVGWARNTVNSILNGFRIDWSQIGRNIVNGIMNGLRSMWASLVALAEEIAQSVLDAFDAVMDMGSPSMAMDRRGMNAALGYMQGWKRGTNPFEIMQLAAVPMQAVGGGRGGSFQMINNYAYGLTERHAERMVRNNLDDVMSKVAERLENW